MDVLSLAAIVAVIGISVAIWVKSRFIRYQDILEARKQRSANKAPAQAAVTTVPIIPAAKRLYNWQFGHALISRLRPDEHTIREILEDMVAHASCDIFDQIHRLEGAIRNIQEILRIYEASDGTASEERERSRRCKEILEELEAEVSMIRENFQTKQQPERMAQ